MEDDEDDFYGAESNGHGEDIVADGAVAGIDTDERMNEDEDRDEANQEEDDDEADDDDDDDDVLFTLEKPEGTSSEPVRPPAQQSQSQDQSNSSETKTTRKESQTAKRDETPRPDSATKSTSGKGVLSQNGKEGRDFPEIRSSKLDVNMDPIWPGNGKPISEMDIDADLAEHSKPWRITGTDQTDYFNYGFDEYTWTMYCLRQKDIRNQIDEQKATEQQMKAALGIGDKSGGMSGGMPPMGGGNMMGMSDMFNPEQMMQQMMAQGVNPANMDFGQFMQMAGQMGGPGMPAGNQPGYGSGQNSASPIPGPGQGFQAPSGPAAQQSMQNSGGMEGYSPQQMAILQEQQGPPMGGGRGRGRRNRGYY